MKKIHVYVYTHIYLYKCMKFPAQTGQKLCVYGRLRKDMSLIRHVVPVTWRAYKKFELSQKIKYTHTRSPRNTLSHIV